VRRSLAEVDPELNAVFGELCAGRSPWPLLLHGAAGRGKTCAALCLLDHARGWYRALPDLLDEVIAVQKGQAVTKGLVNEGGGQLVTVPAFWKEVGSTPLFVLDELGCRDSVSDHHYQTVKRLLDVRECRPLVVISNLSPEAIERLYDDRVASRLAAGTVVELFGDDRRLARS
jgi:chromosomal replication initiation ATPase DnaA